MNVRDMTAEQISEIKELIKGYSCTCRLDMSAKDVLQHIPGFLHESDFGANMRLYQYPFTAMGVYVFILDKEQHILYVCTQDIPDIFYLGMWWVLEPDDMDEFMGPQF